jgi:hypothetical protein
MRAKLRQTSQAEKVRGIQNMHQMRLIFSLVGVVVLLTFLQGCFSFNYNEQELCTEIEQMTLTPVSTPPPAVVFEDPGTIKVMHGSGCAHLGKGYAIKVEQSIDLPAYANQAAVFLNGWKLNYSGGDHHVQTLASALGKIKFEAGKMTWNAVGVLGDSGYDKSIDWCYYFTVIAWNGTNLHAFVDQGDADHFCETGTPSGSDSFFYTDNTGTDTALSAFPTFLQNDNLIKFAFIRAVAVLPRGFGFRWASGEGDHHLLQMAYNLGHSETFISAQSYKKATGELNPLPTPPTDRADSGFVSWNTSAIFKDNETRRYYKFGEFVSDMGGQDVGVIEPPFSILPKEGSCGGAYVGPQTGIQTQDIVIDNIPYAYAIPMLTGWDVEYSSPPCDHHVREIGVWIDDLHYDRNPNAANGTLRCKVSSVLHDDSNNWGVYRHKVTILGLRPL